MAERGRLRGVPVGVTTISYQDVQGLGGGAGGSTAGWSVELRGERAAWPSAAGCAGCRLGGGAWVRARPLGAPSGHASTQYAALEGRRYSGRRAVGGRYVSVPRSMARRAGKM